MKIALISDIHGNLPALEAVLTDLAKDQVDRIICLGDSLPAGPQPEQVLDRLTDLGVELIMGNTDQRLLHPIPLDGLDEHMRTLVEIEAWARQVMSPGKLAWLGNAKQTLDVELSEEQRLLCCHGSPRSLNERLVAELGDRELQDALTGYTFDILAAGHTHIRMLRSLGTGLLINPGTVGAPTGRGPIADYALLESTGSRTNIDFRSIRYDIQTAIAAALGNGMPHAAWWIERWRIS